MDSDSMYNQNEEGRRSIIRRWTQAEVRNNVFFLMLHTSWVGYEGDLECV